MLIYNTTYHVEEGEDKNFLIWMQEHYLPEVEKNGTLYAPRIARILSHIEEGSICYSVQFEVENSAKLHRWHQEQGVKLNEELLNIFKDKVIGFPTLMEVIVWYHHYGVWSIACGRCQAGNDSHGNYRPPQIWRSLSEVTPYS